MTTEQLNAIVEAAKARQGEITPAPWGLVYNHYDKAEGIVSDVSHNDVINARNGILAYSKSEDVDLITAAPDLNAAVIALAARVEALEALFHVVHNPDSVAAWRESLTSVDDVVNDVLSAKNTIQGWLQSGNAQHEDIFGVMDALTHAAIRLGKHQRLFHLFRGRAALTDIKP